MLDVEFYKLYNGLWACDLMPCLCRDFSVIFAIFTNVCCVFHHFFAVIFYCPYWLVKSVIIVSPLVWQLYLAIDLSVIPVQCAYTTSS